MVSRPRPSIWFPVILGVIVAAGVSVHRKRLATYTLYKDDWSFVTKALTPARWREHLWDFHAQHCVPVFRTITAALCWTATDLPDLPNRLRVGVVAAFVSATLATAMLAYYLVGCRHAALCAAAVFALPTVHASVVHWYSASIAAWTTAFVMAALAGWTRYVQTGKPRYWAAGAGCYVLALGTWSMAPVGLVAAAATFAGSLCWLSNRWARRRMAMCLGVGTAFTLLWVALLHRLRDGAPVLTDFEGRSFTEAFHPLTGVAFALRSLVERNILGTLGVRTQPLPAAAAVIYGLLAIAGSWWVWLRFRLSGPAVLGGVTCIVAGYALPYAFRSQVGYTYLQDFTWYACLPQAGLALVVAACSEPLSRRRPTSVPNATRPLTAVVALTCMLWLVHAPLATTLASRLGFPRQRAQLAELELIERLCRAKAIAEKDLRAVLPKYELDGAKQFDGLTLLDLPHDGRLQDPSQIHCLLREALEHGQIPGERSQSSSSAED